MFHLESTWSKRLRKFVRIMLRLTLIGQSILLVLIATETRIPLPDLILASVNERISEKGLEISCESLSFTLRGTIRVEGIVLRTENEKIPPLAKIDQLNAHCSPWCFLTGAKFARSIDGRGGEALFHEGSEVEPIVTDVAFEVILTDDIPIAEFSSRIGNARVLLDAEFDPATLFPKRKGPAKPSFFKRPDLPELYTSFTRTLEQGKSILRNADGAFVAAEVSRNDSGHVISFDSQARNHVGDITFNQAMTHFALHQQNEQWMVEGRPELRIQGGRLSGQGSADNVNLRLEDSRSLQELGQYLRADLRVEGLEIEGSYNGRLASVDAQIEIQSLDRIKTDLLARANRLHLALRAVYQISKLSGSVSGRGELFPEDLNSSQLQKLDLANKLRAPFGISLLKGEAVLGHGGSITEASLRGAGRNVTWRGVQSKRASIGVRYRQGGDWLLDPMVVQVGDSYVQGSYSRKPTRDYRFLLKGFLRPEEINPWMHREVRPEETNSSRDDWWTRLWHDFELGLAMPAGDFDVAGRWHDPGGNHRKVFGSAEFRSISFRKMPVKTGRVKIVTDSNRTIARNLELILKRGWVKGEMSWGNGLGKSGSIDTNFSLKGAVAPSDCVDVLGPTARKTLLQFKSEKTIDFQAEGVTRPDENSTNYDVEANGTHPLRYANIPLDALAFELHRRGRISKVENLTFQFAGGFAKGSIVHKELDGNPSLGVNVTLIGAKRERTIEALRMSKVFSLSESNDTITSEFPGDREETQENDRSVLDFTLKAEGNPNNLLSFEGNGTFNLQDPNLGSIRLFGPLSEILRANPLPLPMPSGSVNFTRLAATYALDRNRTTFDNLSVASSTALLRGKGEMSLQDSMIDFEGRMYLLGGLTSKIPIFGKIADAIDPLSGFLELKLSGSLEDPKWSMNFEPKLLFDK